MRPRHQGFKSTPGDPLLQVTCVGRRQAGRYLGSEVRKLKSSEVKWLVEDQKWQLWHICFLGGEAPSLCIRTSFQAVFSILMIILEFYQKLLPENTLYFIRIIWGWEKDRGIEIVKLNEQGRRLSDKCRERMSVLEQHENPSFWALPPPIAGLLLLGGP